MPGDVLYILWVLLCTVAILGLCYWVTRRMAGFSVPGRFAAGRSGERLEILAKISVAKDQSLLVASVGKRCFLLGCTAGGISLLAELSEEEAALWRSSGGQEEKTAQKSFKDAVNAILHQKVQR